MSACTAVFIAATASAATITVSAGADLQAAINAAQPGDTILLQAGGSASKYPADNFFPPTADFPLQFVSASGGDCRLTTASPYNNAGTDGSDVGANIDRIRAAQHGL